LGFEQGQAYRREHGAAYERVVEHNRALDGAQIDAARLAPPIERPRGTHRETFIDVRNLEPNQVGATISLDSIRD
jgi:hypothetical protein